MTKDADEYPRTPHYKRKKRVTIPLQSYGDEFVHMP